MFGIYAIVTCVNAFSDGNALNGVFVIIICVAVCAIIALSCFKKWGWLLRHTGMHAEADEIEAFYDENGEKRKPTKEERKRLRKDRFKKFFTVEKIAPLCICLPAAAFCLGFAVFQARTDMMAALFIGGGFITGLGLFVALAGAGVAAGVAVYRKKHGANEQTYEYDL